MSNDIEKRLAYIANAWLATAQLDRAVANLMKGARKGTAKTANVLRSDLFEVVRVAQFIISEAKKEPPPTLRSRFLSLFRKRKKG